MDILTANKLYESGELDKMYKGGFVSYKIFVYREIYLWVDAQVKARGITKTKAVLEAEDFFKRSESYIWKALRSFE